MDISILNTVTELKKTVIAEAPKDATVFTVRITSKSCEMEYQAMEGMDVLRCEDHFRTNV